MNEETGKTALLQATCEGRFNKRRRTLLILTGVIVLIAISTTCIFFLFEPSAETALTRYVRTDFTLDYRDFSRYCAYNVEALLHEMYKDSGMTAEDSIWSIKKQSEWARADLKEVYGLGYKFNVEITNIKIFDDVLLEKSIAGMISTFEYLDYDITKVINTDKINKMIDFEYEITVEGKLGISTHQGSMLMARVGRRWGALPSLFW